MDPHRPGYLNGRKCEGSARGATDYRIKELQELAKSLGITYTNVRKGDLCQRIRSHYQSLGTGEVPVFYDAVKNPQGYTRKLEYREMSSEIPFLVVNLERVMQLGIDEAEQMMTSVIIPDSFIMLDEENMLFLRSSVVYQGGHYFSYFYCEGSWWLYDDLKKNIEPIGSYTDLIQKTNISTNGVLHFYTHIDHLCDEKIDCGRMGPIWFDQSCYMDSVLFALFSLGNRYLLRQLLENPITDSQGCSTKVKGEIRAELKNLHVYFEGETPQRPVCRSLRKLFRACQLRSFEDFSAPVPRSPSEFLSYLFAIFDVDDKPPADVKAPPKAPPKAPLEAKLERMLYRLTWGTSDPNASSEVLFDPSVDSILPFVLTSRQPIDFNFIYSVDAFKILDHANQRISELFQTVDEAQLQ